MTRKEYRPKGLGVSALACKERENRPGDASVTQKDYEWTPGSSRERHSTPLTVGSKNSRSAGPLNNGEKGQKTRGGKQKDISSVKLKGGNKRRPLMLGVTA